eukprot:jgi/Botrbrau1/9233/Bobra.0028s0028.1
MNEVIGDVLTFDHRLGPPAIRDHCSVSTTCMHPECLGSITMLALDFGMDAKRTGFSVMHVIYFAMPAPLLHPSAPMGHLASIWGHLCRS